MPGNRQWFQCVRRTNAPTSMPRSQEPEIGSMVQSPIKSGGVRGIKETATATQTEKSKGWRLPVKYPSNPNALQKSAMVRISNKNMEWSFPVLAQQTCEVERFHRVVDWSLAAIS